MATEHPKAQRQARRAMRPGKRQFEEVLDLLYRRRRLILGTLLAVSSLAAAFVLTRPDVYETSAHVLIDLTKAQSGPAPAGANGGAATAPFVRDNRTTDTELFILRSSRGIRERVTARLARENGGTLPDGGVTFEPASRTVQSAIVIRAVSRDPEAAAAWANAYAAEYVTQTQLASRSYLTATREFLQEEANRLQGELRAADGRVAGRSAAGGASSLGAASLLSQMASLRQARDEAMIDLQTRQNQLRSITSQLNDISPRLADQMASSVPREIAGIDQQIATAEAQRQERASYLARQGQEPGQDATYQSFERRIQELETRKATLTSQYVGQVMRAGGISAPEAGFSYVTELQGQAANARVEISGLQGRVQQLNSRIGQLQAEARRAPGTTTAIESGQRDQAQAAEMYDIVATQLQQTLLAEKSESGYASILREADVPTAPTGSNPVKGILMGLLGGLGLGLVLAFARDKVDNRIHKPDHIAALGVSVLEAVPDLTTLIKDELGGATTITVDGQALASELVTIHAPLSPASETYRHLRTRVQFSRPGLLVRTIVVTSGGASEGKSTTAANLAITFAQAGRRTVLIDADLRRPVQHDIFGMAPQNGLAQLLAIGDTSAATLRGALDATFKTCVEHLFVVPTGAVAVENPAHGPNDGRATVLNPSEMLGSVDMRNLLRSLLEVVDVVIVDTPPVLAATDAVLVSTQADATLFVACAGKTKTGDIEQSIAHLDDVGAEVIGAVLNRFSLENAAGYVYTYGHYSRYGPYSKYGPDSKYGAYTGAAATKGRRARRTPPPDEHV